MALPNYNRTTWENADSTQTPLNAANLNNIEDGIARATAAIQALENSGVSPEVITAAVNAYLDRSIAEIEERLSALPEEPSHDWAELNDIFLTIIGRSS